MFKKTLVAATLAALSINAFAVDTKTASLANAQKYGSEALTSTAVANDGSVLTLGTVVLTAGAQYSVGDIIKITLTGGEFAAKGAYTLGDVAKNVAVADGVKDGTTGTTVAGSDTTNDTLTFGLLNQSKTQLTFRVTAKSSATAITAINGCDSAGTCGGSDITVVRAVVSEASTIGNKFTLAGAAGAGVANAVILSSTAAASKVSVTAKAETSTGIAIDNTANDSTDIGSVITEHSFTASTMAAVIDVSKKRKEFVTASAAKITVTHAIATVDQASFVNAASKVTYKVTGNMVGYSDTTAFDGKLTDGTVDLKVATDKQSASTTYTHATSTNALPVKALTFTVGSTDAKREVLVSSDYSVTATILNGTKSVVVGTKTAGKTTLNGASFDLAYVPYGDAVDQFIWVTNKGTLAGEITVSGFDQDGGKYGPYQLGTVDGNKIMKIDAALKTALIADGVGSKRVSLNVTVNAPKANVEIFAAYKVIGADDRLTLPVKALN